MYHLPYHLNQNPHYNSQSLFSLYQQKIDAKKNQKTTSSILQPHQPQNYLHSEFNGTKQISLLSCKSQPLKVTRRKKSSSYQLNCCIKNRDFPTQLTQHSSQLAINENKRTRKQLTCPQVNFRFQCETQQGKQRFQQSKCNKKIHKVRGPIDCHSEQKNEQTLRKKNKKCPHKSKSKQIDVKRLSIQNLNSRLTICQAYIDLSSRKTNILAQQLEFLLSKQQQRHERKKKNRELKHQKLHHKGHRYHDYGFDANEKQVFNVDLYQTQKAQVAQLVKKTKKHKTKMVQSSAKFHYRSCDNISSLSRMKQLLYFNQNDKSYEHTKEKHIQKTNNCESNNSKILPLKINKKPQNNSQNSIYQQFECYNLRNTSLSMRNTQRPLRKSIDRPLVYSHFIATKAQPYIDQSPQISTQNLKKSQKQPYQQESQYLLQEYQNDTLRQKKYPVITHNTLQKSQIRQVNFPLVHSDLIASPNSHSEVYNHEGSYNQEACNQYLTREFHASEDDGYVEISPQRLTFSKNPNQESAISNKSSLKSNRSRKVGHITQGSKIQQNDNDFTEKYLSQSPKNVLSLKNNQKQLKSQNNSQKSGKQVSQKQYTFINHDSNRKNSSSGNFKIIDSNMNSPQRYDYIISSNQNTEAQLIRQFDELVIAAAQERTPIKKKLIREQIYRTTQEIKLLKSNNEKPQLSAKVIRPIQNK